MDCKQDLNEGAADKPERHTYRRYNHS